MIIIIIIIISIIILNLAILKALEKSIFAAIEESKDFSWMHRCEDSQGKKIPSRETRCVYSVYCSGMHIVVLFFFFQSYES